MDYDNTVFGMFGGRENYEKGVKHYPGFCSNDKYVGRVCKQFHRTF